MAPRTSYGVLFLAGLACLATVRHGLTLTVKNAGSDPLTVYYQRGAQATPDTVQLDAGTSQDIQPGDSFEAGVVWAGNSDKAKAGLAEFTIPASGQSTYDISLVNAYNVPIEISPGTVNGDLCKDIKCSIAGLQGFCSAPDQYTAAGNGDEESCTNVDGPQQASQPECCCSTDSTKKFKHACPDAYSFSKDDASSTFHCDQVTDFTITFNGPGDSSDIGLPCPQAS